ncbi:IdeS/Mac family cysteine endopeptidase [Treponema pectinovorum]|uniref:IdeS/Mac family cysteine endopeptidase n=1 Tax=Treponema pectinovorum TaxID=164 RepID=UPI0011C88363|nr:IdeS/Mac family cysteine endopeptidase [Treponema pectinovorum]
MRNKFFIYVMFIAILLSSCKDNYEQNDSSEAKVVKVQDISIKNLTNPISLVKDTTYQIEATVLPENATDKKISYYSSTPTVANVDEKGLVSALNVGTSTITLKVADKSKTISVTVTAGRVNVTGISLAPSDENVSIIKGKTHKLNASVEPATATDKTLTYSSDHEDIASVDPNGLISAKKVGTASVRINAADNITKTVNVTVTEAEVVVTGIELNPPLSEDTITLTIGQEYNFGARVVPDNATNKNLKFTTSDSSTAWLCGDGNSSVRGEKEGTATITIQSESNPSVKKIVNLKIKPKPSIRIKTNPEMCGSGGGNVSFTMETLNGKLNYTPEIVGGGKKWLTIDGKDSVSENEDTIRFTVNKNNTSWERTAYVKFKDADGKYIKSDTKGSNGKYDDMQVKLTQKKNDNPEVTIKWVYGITPPKDTEKRKIEIGSTGTYHEMSYVFEWYETTDTTFFNTRKVTHTGAPAGGFPDGKQCWAKTDANMLHWWFEQNKDNINQYKLKKNITGDAAKPYEPFYTRGLADNMEHEKSSIANIFRKNFINFGGNPANGLQWYLFGFDGLINARPNTSSPALFKDVFNEANSPIKQPTIYTKKEFEDTIKDALDSKKAVGLNRYGTDTSQHAITLWGAAFDKDNNIVAIYVVDNNEKPNRVFPYGIWYQKGVDIYADTEHEPDQNNPHFYNPYFINYSSNTYDRSHYIGEITTLDKGEKQWQKWLDEN